MKKKILSGLFASALLIAAAIGAMESKKSEAGLSDLAMANVEALATREGPGYTFYCCGNTNTCAKGIDQDTGNEFIIHGTLKSNPCK